MHSGQFFAQQSLLRFEHIQPETDASEAIVFGIQDRRGYLWFGTTSGLVRHDGRKMMVWVSDPDDPFSLPGNDVNQVSEISDSLMWIGTKYSGLSRFNRRNLKFQTFLHDPNDRQSIGSDNVHMVRQGPQGFWWLGTSKGLQMMKPGTELGKTVFQRFPIGEPTEENPGIFNIEWEPNGHAWLCSTNGFWFVPGEDWKRFTAHPDGARPVGTRFLAREKIFDLHLERGKGMWIAGLNGLWFWPWEAMQSRNAEGIQALDPSANGPTGVRDLMQDRAGNLWFASNGQGIFRLSPGQRAQKQSKNMRFEHFDYDARDKGSFVGGVTNHLLEDRSGNIWMMAMFGLDMLNPRQSMFGHGKPNPAQTGAAKENTIFAILPETDGTFWLGTQEGLSLMAKNGERLGKWFPAQESLASPYKNAIRSILRISDHLLIVSTLDGLWQFDQNTEDFSSISGLNDALGKQLTKRIFKILLDQDGSLWLGGVKGVLHYFPKSHLLHHFQFQTHNPQSLSANFVRNLHLDAQGNLWIATENGLDLLTAQQKNQENAAFQHFQHNANDPQSLSNNQVRALSHDQKGNIWVGTDGGGMNCLDPKTGKFKRYLKKDGLCNNVIYGLLHEKDSPRIWASTAHGISCFDPNTNQFQNYDLKDGLQDNEFNVRAAAREEDGRLIFGGVNGYNRFYPHELSPNKQAPPVVINGFRLNNQQVDFRNSPTLSAPIEFVDEIQLQHSDNIFSFEFTALDYTNPLKNQFRYRLQGFSDKWVDCGNEKKATFTNLPAGNYTFEVEASNNDGVWNNQSTSLRLSIKPALWASWWAKMIYFFGILSLLWFAWRTWRNRMRMQEKLRLEKLHAERYQELEQLKSQFFAGISHEFRTPLSLIIGPLEKMRKEIQSEVGQRNVEMIHRNAHRLLRLVNQLLVVAGLEEGKLHLHPSEQDLNLFIRQIIASFRPGAEEKGLELQYIGTENPVILCFDIENFEHIFYNLLANALRFTARGGKILVRTFASQTQVSIQVSDTGIGIPIEVQARLFERFYQVPGEQSAGGTGLGLALVKELTELHQGKVSVESSPGKGTVFTLVFPFQNGLKAQKVQPTQVATLPINRPKASKTTENDPEKRIILIVEDNADLRTFIRSELEQEFAILEANQGEEGLQMATEHVPDLIISDVMMPVMDGIKMSYALKSKAVTSHIPIIMLTARTAELSRIEGLQAGADDYLTKPFSATELRLRIQNRFFYLQKVAERLKAAPSELQEMSVPVKRENQFLKGVQLELEKALDNSDFSVEELAAAVNLSRKQLYRKIKALTQKTPSQFMRSFRLQKGQELLQSASLNVSQVAYSVGFSSPSYFSRCFQEEFGYSPSETKKDH